MYHGDLWDCNRNDGDLGARLGKGSRTAPLPIEYKETECCSRGLRSPFHKVYAYVHMQSLLFGVKALDFAAFLLVAVVLLAAAILASLLLGTRAASASPMHVLRTE